MLSLRRGAILKTLTIEQGILALGQGISALTVMAQHRILALGQGILALGQGISALTVRAQQRILALG